MKAKTIEEEEYSEMLQKCYDFVKNEAHQSMRNKANRDVVDYYDDFAYEIKKFLEQKLIQPEPQTVGEEDIWNKEQMEKVKDYILTESSKQTEEQKKHIIDFANRLSETKQVTEDEILNQLDLIILNWLKSESENTTQLSFDIVEYFKGLSLKESQKVVEEITIFTEKEYHFQFRDLETLKGISDYKVSGKRLMQYLHNEELSLQNKEEL